MKQIRNNLNYKIRNLLAVYVAEATLGPCSCLIRPHSFPHLLYYSADDKDWTIDRLLRTPEVLVTLESDTVRVASVLRSLRPRPAEAKVPRYR